MLRLRFAIGGEDRLLPLTGGRVRLGRGSDNDVVLADVSVSRNHAEIRRGPDGWHIHDLRSTNGIEINRVSVRSAPLRPGDRITIGVFELAVESTLPPPANAAASAEPSAAGAQPPGKEQTGGSEVSALANATIVRPLADLATALGLQGAAAPGAARAAGTAHAAPADGDAHRMLGFLTRLARVLLVADSVDDVLVRVLDIVFEALPVERAFILLSEESGDLVCEAARFKDRVQLRPKMEVPVSRTMLRAVMRERVALVTFDALADQRLSGGESIRLHQIRAAMCTPLWSGDRIIGVVQADSPYHVGAFGEREVDFLATVANYAAVAVERIRYAAKAEFEKTVRTRLERYHSPALIEEVLRQGAGGDDEGIRRLRAAEATVLFADLVGFTAFAEDSTPEHAAELLNAFLNLSVEAIFAAGGTLDKFIGDCVMAFFGAPMPQPDHAERAVRAAVEIQRNLQAWSAARAAQGLPGFAARVAVNSGPVVVGDIGSARRVDYTVLGNTVNVAARLEAVARPGDVVLGPETHRLLGGAIPTEPLGEYQLRGLQQKILAHRVVG
ncbi:MAG TPA: adenylate/guanylate cyclase domain-containing protein [Thermoanaerobaculia bacterium]|jgi:adenylate cyclase|nr:adenylate/guanylate cyclase domain-containing protein [Thermoanaerobaculia bacterium]